ncbi:unnamed protein product [Protopolystoma xenopodis]|uniref:BHLH domain-containing protein n=1 Tax=Protopolystoma xenopodis TaxID=117903 RepID=A0A3S5CLX6_9PLAT|nr:unnamed protein product [Protopolystoma xenopodis]
MCSINRNPLGTTLLRKREVLESAEFPVGWIGYSLGRFAPQKPQTESVRRRNARERFRVRGINASFDSLRACLPIGAVSLIDKSSRHQRTYSRRRVDPVLNGDYLQAYEHKVGLRPIWHLQ